MNSLIRAGRLGPGDVLRVGAAGLRSRRLRVFLSALGISIGIAVTTGYAATRDWSAVVPPWATAGGFGATLVIGAIAGLYPAVRAARLTPREALARV